MRETSISELEQFIADGRLVEKYAWVHYEELAARKSTYTLYGPMDYGIGAALPGKFIPQRARKLQKKTRRKDYIVYELDSNYKLLRTVLVYDYTKIHVIYHCFERNGILYACPFLGPFYGTQKKLFRNEILAVGYKDNRPEFLGFLREHSLIVQFFDYASTDKVFVTTYSYTPTAKITVHGYPVNHKAPIGALDSPVEKGFWEEVPAYTDFSQWFK